MSQSGDDGARVTETERELLARLRAGDEVAFRTLVHTHQLALTRIARLYVGAADVDEVVQETWVGVINGLARFEGRSSIKTWMYQILLNQARRRFRSVCRTIPFDLEDPASSGRAVVDLARLQHPELGPGYWTTTPPAWQEDPEGQLLNREVHDVVVKAIMALRLAQREVITLRDICDTRSHVVSELVKEVRRMSKT